MGDPMKDAWADVAEGFSSLGRAIKDRYQGDDSSTSPEAAAAGLDQALRDALDRFVAAGREIGQRAVDVVRDPDVGAQARQAAARLDDALSATVDVIGHEVAGWFGRRDGPIDAANRPTDDDGAHAAVAAGGDEVDDGEVEGPNSA
jgi:hypothetical protein